MADSFIQVAPDSTGKKMQTYENTISGQVVEAEAVVLADSTGTALGTNSGALNVSIVGSINASINTALLATSAHQTDGNQKTQIVDGSGNVIGSTGNALNIYLPTITANAGANLNTSALALAVTQTNGGQKTQIVDPSNASNVAGITNSALNVYLPSITANAGTNLNTSLLATSTKQSDGSQKSQVVDGSGNVIGSTGNALDVNLKTPATVSIKPETATLVSSSALEASHVLKASAGKLVTLIGFNNKSGSQFIQIHNAASLPANGAVPSLVFTVPTLSNFSIDIPLGAGNFGTGITVCNSSTLATKTIGAADCFFTSWVI